MFLGILLVFETIFGNLFGFGRLLGHFLPLWWVWHQKRAELDCVLPQKSLVNTQHLIDVTCLPRPSRFNLRLLLLCFFCEMIYRISMVAIKLLHTAQSGDDNVASWEPESMRQNLTMARSSAGGHNY